MLSTLKTNAITLFLDTDYDIKRNPNFVGTYMCSRGARSRSSSHLRLAFSILNLSLQIRKPRLLLPPSPKKLYGGMGGETGTGFSESW